MNKLCLIGRITKTPDVRVTASGEKLARFTLAVNRNKELTDFIPCVAFKKDADIVDKYCQKGSQIGVEGRIQSGSYEKDGVKHYTLDCIVNHVDLLGSKPKQEESDGFSVYSNDSAEDMPF